MTEPRASATSAAGQVARRWANKRLAAVEAYGRILADYGSGRSTSGAAAGALARLAVEETVRYPGEVMSLAADYLTALGGRAATSPDMTAAASRSVPICDLDLVGALGAQASGTFQLANPHDRAAVLSFLPATFSGAAGDTALAARFVPAEFVLQPGAEQSVVVSVLLAPDLVRAGEVYTANVAVDGFDEMILRLRLTVLDPG